MKYADYWSFFLAWWHRALSNSAGFSKLDLKSILSASALLILTIFFYWTFKGPVAAKEEMAKRFMSTIAPSAVFLTGLLFFNLWRAPFQIYRDEQAIASGDLGKKMGELIGMTNRAVTAEELLRQARETIRKTEEAEIRRKGTAALAVPAASAPFQDRKPIREAIAKLMEEGNALVASCLIGEENPDLVAKADDWANRTYKFLQGFDAGDAARFSAAVSPPISHTGVSIKNNNVWAYLMGHVEILGSILSELRGR